MTNVSKLIGITGGIGSGKSTIARGMQDLGYPVYDADSNAKRIIVSNPTVRAAVQQLFGEQVIHNGVYDTRLVAAEVFHNPDLLHRLNAIVHPAVMEDLKVWYHAYPLSFVESAILYNSGLADMCDATIVITAPEEVRIERTMARDHVTRQQVIDRIQNQHSEDDLARADLVINNDGNEEIYKLCLHIQKYFCTFAV